jgi:hypothetical protein
MISVVIPTLDDEEALVLSLAALVPAAAEGIVREVVVVDGGSSDETLRVADATGCTLVVKQGPAGGRASVGAVTVSRGTFLLFLQPGVVLDARWEVEAATFIDRASRAGLADERFALFRFARDHVGASSHFGHAAVHFASRVIGRPHPAQPLLLSRRLYGAVGGHRTLETGENAELARRLGRRRLVRLKTAAWIVPPRPQR